MNPAIAELSTTERMLKAAADLLRTGGIDAVSTRAVAAGAGVQPPTIYRQFGDKDGLLDAVARYVLQGYIEERRMIVADSDDPAVELRRLWDLHVGFGLTQPDCYVLTYGQARPGRMLAVAGETIDILAEVVARMGDQGRLRMSVERATAYLRSCGTGYVLAQISMPSAERDRELSSILFESALATITNDHGRKTRTRRSSELPGRAIALREALRDNNALPLTAAESILLAEWLNRLADNGSPPV